MCFAEPGQIMWTDGSIARVDTSAGQIEASLTVLRARGDHVGKGDWVVVALGLAIEHITAVDGRRLLDEHRTLFADAGTESAVTELSELTEGAGIDVR